MQPKISIIIPVFNVEKYVAECLESCIHQTLKEIEIIVVDDCGSDRSIEIAREYASRDCRVKILEQKENFGPFECRNVGAKIASGEYLCFLDADDFLDLNACEIALQDGFDYIAFGAFQFYDGVDKQEFCAFKKQEFLSLEDYANWLYGQKYPNQSIWGKLIKKEKYLKAIGSFNPSKISMAEDVLVNFFLICECERFLNLSNNLYYYRFNPHSTSHTKNIKKIKENYKDLEFVLDIIQNHSSKNKKIASLYSLLLKDELQKTALKIKSMEGGLCVLDKLERFFFQRYFALRRKIRIKCGI